MVWSGDVGRVLLLRSRVSGVAGWVEHPDIEIVVELELQYYITTSEAEQLQPRR